MLPNNGGPYTSRLSLCREKKKSLVVFFPKEPGNVKFYIKM